MAEVAVLERPGEERPGWRNLLELGAVVAEADDDGARVEPFERFEQDLHALVLDELPEVENGRRIRGEELGEALGVARIGMPLVAIVRIAARLLEQRRESRVARLRAERV